ncbi:hypothetical protein [Paenibacillus sp. SI8]|uniref:hypothetical protein n=1 Tax=unclassified Paenibacillus TaxID=185978 RepID=UPI003466A067
MKKNLYGNRILHDLFYRLAIKQITVPKNRKEATNPVLYAYFESKQKQGKTKHQAYVCVMRKLANVVQWMMRIKQAYLMPAQTEVN